MLVVADDERLAPDTHGCSFAETLSPRTPSPSHPTMGALDPHGRGRGGDVSIRSPLHRNGEGPGVGPSIRSGRCGAVRDLFDLPTAVVAPEDCQVRDHDVHAGLAGQRIGALAAQLRAVLAVAVL